MTLLESDLDSLIAHLGQSKNEEAAYLLARIASTDTETRLLVRSVLAVPEDQVDSRSPNHLSINSPSYVSAIKRAGRADSAFVFVHSHPNGPDAFSQQDDREEFQLFSLAHARNPRACHASMVFDGRTGSIAARAWLPDGSAVPIQPIRIIGGRWRFLWRDENGIQVPELFDRQVRAFGSEAQRGLQRLHIGIVGAGGTGSAVAEQLIRLGVGKLTVVDDDVFDPTNVNRVFGSRASDGEISKTALVKRQADLIGTGTQVREIPRHLSFRDASQELRNCDVIFGCTDDEWGRSILTRLSIYYFIPVLDLGAVIDPDDTASTIRSVQARLTVLQPGLGCLFCRERISSDGVRAESIAATDPARAALLRAEGYLRGQAAPAPAVVSFTSAAASMATAELLDRLIAFKDTDQKASEYLYRFDADRMSKNTRPPKADCFCADRRLWGAGDRKLFLGLSWRAT